MAEDCEMCEHYRERGDEFCPMCGKHLREPREGDCPDCASWRAKGVDFCKSCGHRVNGTEQAADPEQTECTKNPVYRAFAFVALAVSCFVLAVAVAYTVLHFTDLLNVFTPLSKCLFVIAFVAIVLCAVYALVSLFKRTDRFRNKEKIYTSGISAAASAMCVSLILTILYAGLLAIFGKSIDSSWIDEYTEYQEAALLFMAGPKEEFLCRVLPIGIPMLIIALVYRRGKESLRYVFGGFGVSRAAWVLIIVSSVIFGMLHNTGWGWTKIIDAFVAGIIFGYLYVEYGLYACILAHTVNDTLSFISFIGLGDVVSGLVTLSLLICGLAILVLWLLFRNKKQYDFKNMPWFNGPLPPTLKEQWGGHRCPARYLPVKNGRDGKTCNTAKFRKSMPAAAECERSYETAEPVEKNIQGLSQLRIPQMEGRNVLSRMRETPYEDGEGRLPRLRLLEGEGRQFLYVLRKQTEPRARVHVPAGRLPRLRLLEGEGRLFLYVLRQFRENRRFLGLRSTGKTLRTLRTDGMHQKSRLPRIRRRGPRGVLFLSYPRDRIRPAAFRRYHERPHRRRKKDVHPVVADYHRMHGLRLRRGKQTYRTRKIHGRDVHVRSQCRRLHAFRVAFHRRDVHPVGRVRRRVL